MSLADLVTATAILAGAVWLLYRSVWKKKGGCHGCTSGACGSRPREAPDLVHLGRGAARGATGGAPTSPRPDATS